MSAIRPFAALGVAFAALAAMAFFALPAHADDETVTLSGTAFNPSDVTVQEGDTVTWVHEDPGMPHNVISTDGGPLDSGNFDEGESFAFTFESAGTYEYECTIHPGMTGSVTVEAAAEPSDDAAVDDTNDADDTNGVDDANGVDDDAVDDRYAGEATPESPTTGTGLAGDGGSSAAWMLLAAGAAAAAIGGGAAFATARRR